MKRYSSALLIALNLVLVAVLAWLWIKPNGELKNIHWADVRGQKSNLDGIVPALGKPQTMDQSQFLAMLDRPLFSPTRRPPPPPPPPESEAPPPPPDYLSEAVLTGIYMSEDGKSGGAIIRFDGKDKSLPLRGVLDGWTLNSIAGSRVYFTRGKVTKEISLQKAKLQDALPGASQAPAGRAGRAANGRLPQAAPAAAPPATDAAASRAPRRKASIGGAKTNSNR